MLKSKQINKLTALYLKQFFNNHTIKNSQAQSINFLSSSLEVLEELLNNFMLKYHISTSQTHNTDIKDLNLQEKQQNLAVQFGSLYQKVKKLLQWTQSVLQKRKFGEQQLQLSQYKLTSSRLVSDRMNYAQSYKNTDVNDQQLYEILNEYKRSNKKNKETIQALYKKVEDTKNQYLEIKIKKQIIEKQCVYLNSRIQQLQKEIDTLQAHKQKSKLQNNANNQQISRLTKKVEDLEQNIRQITQQNIQINKNLNGLKSTYNKLLLQKSQLQEKLQSTYQQINCKINKSINQLPQFISNKLQDKKYWNMAALQVLTKYMKYSNKQNISFVHKTSQEKLTR